MRKVVDFRSPRGIPFSKRNLTFNLLDPDQIRLTLCYTNYCFKSWPPFYIFLRFLHLAAIYSSFYQNLLKSIKFIHFYQNSTNSLKSAKIYHFSLKIPKIPKISLKFPEIRVNMGHFTTIFIQKVGIWSSFHQTCKNPPLKWKVIIKSKHHPMVFHFRLKSQHLNKIPKILNKRPRRHFKLIFPNILEISAFCLRRAPFSFLIIFSTVRLVRVRTAVWLAVCVRVPGPCSNGRLAGSAPF